MYGLLVENLASFIRIQWGESKWDMVRKNAGIDAPSFSIHHVYPETLLNKLARSAYQVLEIDDKSLFEAMGIYFIEYVGQYGYDAMLTVLGRHMRDFLNGLDNLHEYLKFSYTKMRAPSFYTDEETAQGLRLHYRSRRRGFVYYVIGQIKQVAIHFYNMECGIELLSETLDGETMHTIFQLTFDNDAFSEHESLKSMIRQEEHLPIRASIIFELFPFCIVFSQDMTIKFTGHALLTILKDLVGQVMTEAFEILKPLITFSFSTIMERRNNIFELITSAPIKDDEALTGSFDNDSEDETGTSLKLRGQMMYMEEWDMMLFLANPVMPDLDSLVQAGLFINDLSLHDCSRDLVLAGTQQSVELKLALDQEQHKSKKLEESMKKLDDEIKRTDELLYQMIPHKVADRIRSGATGADTCEVFECVSILFSDVVTFTDICSRITPMQVVTMLNHMYSLFDQLTERNGVYKVETIGDSYMVVSGAPEPMAQHAERICDMAMDMVDAMQAIGDPSRDGEPLKIRVGCHSGNVVAGVVGVKMPRYCLFGDAVNTASRMESSSIGGRIQISAKCKELLPAPYQTDKRGTVEVKGKGEMETYWLIGRDNRVPLSKTNSKSFNWSAPTSTGAGAEPIKSGIPKQVSVSSDASGIVKDGSQKPEKETKKIVRQSTINKISLDTNPATINLNEPKNSSFNKPVEMSETKPNINVTKPVAVPAAAQSVSTGKPSMLQTQSASVDSNAPPTLKTKPTSPKKEPPQVVQSKPPNSDPMPKSTTTAEQKLSPPKSGVEGAVNSPPKPPTANASAPPPRTIDLPPNTIRRASFAPTEQVQEAVSKVASATTTVTVVNNNPTIDKENTPEVPPPIQESITIFQPNNNGETVEISINNLNPTDISMNGEEEGQESKNSFFAGINGIRKGSRDFRDKIREKTFSTVTVDAITDMGCTEFAVKQKEMISQACVLL